MSATSPGSDPVVRESATVRREHPIPVTAANPAAKIEQVRWHTPGDATTIDQLAPLLRDHVLPAIG